jgi:adenylosuccinate lyase
VGVIERYTRPAMGSIWSEAAKYQAWSGWRLSVCEAYARRGRIPARRWPAIRDTRVDIDRILAIQGRGQARDDRPAHQPGRAARPRLALRHIGLTTNDVWDTATALQLRAPPIC